MHTDPHALPQETVLVWTCYEGEREPSLGMSSPYPWREDPIRNQNRPPILDVGVRTDTSTCPFPPSPAHTGPGPMSV